jgi:hypothetical protein
MSLNVRAVAPVKTRDDWGSSTGLSARYVNVKHYGNSYPPIQTSSSVDRILFSGVGIAETPWPQPNATATLE